MTATPPTPHRPYLLSPHTTGPLLEDHWPGLFFTIADVAEIRRKAKTRPWAQALLAQMREEAEIVLASPPTLEMEPSGWRHDFYSRRTGEHLVFEPDGGADFLDPCSGIRERDDAQRRAWVLLSHERTYRLMRSLALLHHVTGDRRYGRWAAAGMQQAATYFALPLPRRSDLGGPAHYFSNLYDAAILAQLGAIYELTRDLDVLQPADHDAIRRRIFEDRMPTMIEFLRRRPTHNMSCFVSLALATAGRLYNRRDWTELAFGPDTGLRTQLMAGLPTDAAGQCDGFWYEGTMFYHYYSLCPLLGLWQLQRTRGDADENVLRDRLIGMFAAPPTLADDQWRLPTVGDLANPRYLSLHNYAHLYEYAAGQLDAGRFAPLLAALCPQRRRGWAALAFGLDELPEPAAPLRRSTRLPVTGVVMLRNEHPARAHVLFRCGRYHGGHDHPDRLMIALSALGELVSPDLGEPGYSLRELGPVRRYFRTTASHNTLGVDEGDQHGDATLVWGGDDTVPWAAGEIIGDGWRLRRKVVLDGDCVVVLDDCTAEADRRFAWYLHAYGSLTVATPVLERGSQPQLDMPPLPDREDFACWSARRTGVVEGTVRACWRVSPRVMLDVAVLADDRCEVTAGVTPGQPYPDTLGGLMLRSPGRRRRFAAVLHPRLAIDAPTDVTLDVTGSELIVRGRAEHRYGWAD